METLIGLRKLVNAGDELPQEVIDSYGHYIYKRDYRAVKSLNKTLGTNFVAVYRNSLYYRDQMKANDISIDTGDTYVVTADKRLVRFTNSEWFAIEEIKNDKQH